MPKANQPSDPLDVMIGPPSRMNPDPHGLTLPLYTQLVITNLRWKGDAAMPHGRKIKNKCDPGANLLTAIVPKAFLHCPTTKLHTLRVHRAYIGDSQ